MVLISDRVQNPIGDIIEVSEWKKVKPMYLWKVRNTPERKKPLGAPWAIVDRMGPTLDDASREGPSRRSPLPG
jgi:hypothetical protein